MNMNEEGMLRKFRQPSESYGSIGIWKAIISFWWTLTDVTLQKLNL